MGEFVNYRVPKTAHPHNRRLDMGHAGRTAGGLTRGAIRRDLAQMGDTIFRTAAYTELG